MTGLTDERSTTRPTVGLCADLFADSPAAFASAVRLLFDESPLVDADLVTSSVLTIRRHRYSRASSPSRTAFGRICRQRRPRSSTTNPSRARDTNPGPATDDRGRNASPRTC
ncbi:hypothetical protein D8S78_23770 [Natrialba swarupiae]|nr:hypothetical protein [Natrialba swarupiae]